MLRLASCELTAVNFKNKTSVARKSSSRAPPDSYPVGTGGSLPGVKRPGIEADHSPPCSAEVKNDWKYTSNSSIRLHGVIIKRWDNFNLKMQLICCLGYYMLRVGDL
jgi:hypothetical protein